ncbi:LytTR family DNA-binding domain-containing protein [Leptobacterium sp. I13]|uniref:LytR/AlgR family response regulator transcription factor n=1 Tax=Leptobacterium meishanense TaxID=3128904 RepID=UPI0030EB6B46
MIRVAIVDDEPNARRYLSGLLKQDAEIHLVAQLVNGRAALELLEKDILDIVFLDIHMPGINGIEVAMKIMEKHNVVIIFSTAYDQYAIKAFESEALDYLLKPFDSKRFFHVLDRAKEQVKLKEQKQFNEKLTSLYKNFQRSQAPHFTTFIIKEKGIERHLDIHEVIYLEANGIYVNLMTTDKKYLYRASLQLLEEQLPEELFIRVHRSIILNRKHIADIKYLNNNTFSFTMENGKTLTSSRSYKNDIQQIITEN